MIETLIVVALASFRVAKFLGTERGPGDLFRLIRKKLGNKLPAVLDTEQATLRQHWIVEGVNCPLCIGVYTAPVLYALYGLPIGQWVVIALAIAGLQTIFQRMFG